MICKYLADSQLGITNRALSYSGYRVTFLVVLAIGSGQLLHIPGWWTDLLWGNFISHHCDQAQTVGRPVERREEQQMRKLWVTMLFFIPGLEPSILCRDHFTIWQFTSCRTNLSQPPVEKGLKEVELNWDLFWFVNLEVVISTTKLHTEHSQSHRAPAQTCWNCLNNNNQQTDFYPVIVILHI